MNYIKFVRIFLLVLIVIGLGLLATQKIWVPKVVDMIMKGDKKEVSITQPNAYESCIVNGGKDITPNYNAPKKCLLNDRIIEENCVSNNKYFVISKRLMEEAGTDTVAKYKTSPSQFISCDYSVGNGDFKLTDSWAEYVMALENNFLIFDSGTGPDPRGLTVYDLNTRKQIFHDSYSRPVDIQNNTISYWTESSVKATEENCRNFLEYERNGTGAEAIDTHVSLNLKTLVKTDLGEHRCSPRQ